MSLSQRNQRVNVDHFSMVPRSDVPRSTFHTQNTHKTTMQGGTLVPIYCEEILPGDTFKGEMTVFARMATLLFPLMDHITLETFFFYCPNRLVWANWVKLMGQRDNPADSISYTVPQVPSPPGGWLAYTVQDYFGLPTVGQIGGGAVVNVNAMPLRMYNKIYNEWFRDENLQNAVPVSTGDGPDGSVDVVLLNRNKRHDYFTSALPWPLKNGTSVSLPLSGTAPVLGIAVDQLSSPASGIAVYETGNVGNTYAHATRAGDFATNNIVIQQNNAGYPTVFADLSQAAGATISALRLAVQTQRLLERDARGGTRYTETLQAHFGIHPEDFRLQRPEYIGGGKTPVVTQAVPQTSATGATGTPLASLGGASVATGQHNFRYDAKEHGFIIGLAHIDAELTYQQGLHRMWTRQTRYDYYWPVFAHLSEQPIRNDEIFVQGTSADSLTFGYQERWAEYRHAPSRITGGFKSTTASNLDPWHSAQVFGSLPTLASTFIQSSPPFSRNLAAGSLANNQQFYLDMLFSISRTRPMPMYSVPGGMDRF